jgi:hypothetical protein
LSLIILYPKEDYNMELYGRKEMGDGQCKIGIPVKYEEVYVNGKKLGSKDVLESILSSMKGMIGGGKKEEGEEKMVRKKKEAPKEEFAPLFEGSLNTREVLPLFGGKILSKRGYDR